MFYWVDDERNSLGSGNAAISMMNHHALLPKITEINKKYCKMMDEYKAKRGATKLENRPEDKPQKLSWRQTEGTDKNTSKTSEKKYDSRSEKKYDSRSEKKPYAPPFKKVKDDDKLSWRRKN